MKSGKHTLPSYFWFGKTLVRCSCPPLDAPFFRLHLSYGKFSIPFFLFTHWPRGLRALPLHLTVWTFCCPFWYVRLWLTGCSLRDTLFRSHLRVEVFLFSFSFPFLSALFSRSVGFIPPARQVFRAILSFGYRFCAPIAHKLWSVACKTIALGYCRPLKYHTHAL